MIFWKIYLICLIVKIVNATNSAAIVVVGAGSAGIAAATKLYENGFDNVKILEAEDRIGGRVNTIQLDDYAVDLGAEWVHGQINNVAYQLAAPLGLLANSTLQPLFDIYSFSDETSYSEIYANATSFFVNVSDNISNLNESDLVGSVGDYFDKQFATYFESHPEINRALRKKLLDLFNILQTAGDASESWYEPSMKGYKEYHVCEGDLMINWKERGYSTILDVLMKRIPDPKKELPILNNTILNTEVSNINYVKGDAKIKIRTANKEEYLADHVIMTPSLGVLKENYKTLFEPPLPVSKIESIQGLSFAACKLHMVFNETWWQIEDNHIGMAFLWDESDKKELERHSDKKWLTSITCLLINEYKPRLLSIWISAKGCRLMENLPDQQVVEHTMEVLHTFLGNSYNITEPIAMARSKWSTNRHFRGTYSFRSIESEKVNASAAILAEPIVQNGSPKILFAGEATEKNYFSTVHGAIASGWREADRLIDFYFKKSK